MKTGRGEVSIAIQKAYVGFNATDADNYDGAPDAEWPSNCVGHGMSPSEAEADLREQLELA